MNCLYRVGKKRGYRLMTIILSILNRFKNFSLEDSLVNLKLNVYYLITDIIKRINLIMCKKRKKYPRVSPVAITFTRALA